MIRKVQTSNVSLPWLIDWANCVQNFPGDNANKIATTLIKDASVIEQLKKLTNRLTHQTNDEVAQKVITEMLDDCILVSGIVVEKYGGTTEVSTLPTRTDQLRELAALANDLKSLQKKLKELGPSLGNAVSVSYLTSRHCAGSPGDFSKQRLPSLRLDRPDFDGELTITHLLKALHDDVVEVGGRVEKGIRKKRQTGGHDKLATKMIDAVWRVVRDAIGRDSKPSPNQLVVELCRVLLTIHGYDKTLDESTVRSRRSKL